MLKALIEDSPRIATHRGWSRALVDSSRWHRIGEALREGKLQLLGEWGDVAAVHCALYEPQMQQVQIASIDASSGQVPSLAAFHPPASRLERAIVDLFGIEMVGLPDPRAWLTGLPVSRSRGTRPAPDPRGSRACRHHRAGPLPLHGKR
jgi:Respiratory-chain NADH dehydrogenase, 30 Kd subunit